MLSKDHIWKTHSYTGILSEDGTDISQPIKALTQKQTNVTGNSKKPKDYFLNRPLLLWQLVFSAFRLSKHLKYYQQPHSDLFLKFQAVSGLVDPAEAKSKYFNCNFFYHLTLQVTKVSLQLFIDERNSETESQTNEDSSDTQISSGLNIGSLNHTTIHGSTESIASKPAGKQHTNGTDKGLSHQTKQSATQKIATASGMLQKTYGSDSKMLAAVGLDSRPGTPKDKDQVLGLINKSDSTPNALKHKLTNSNSNANSVKKNNNKKARHR